jgi:cell division protein FtsB
MMKTILVLLALFSAITALEIHCGFQMEHWWTQIGNQYSCKVITIFLTGNKSLERVTGIHDIERSNDDVKQIVFGSPGNCSFIDFVPQDIHSHFPNLIGIAFEENCMISTLNGDELKDYSNLEWFSMYGNPVERIPGNFFEFNPKVRLAHFSWNQISQVGSSLFSGLQNLTTASFLANPCISESVYQNRTGILQLIQHLREKCVDPYDWTTTTTLATTTTITEDPSCPAGNATQRICDLEDETQTLREKNEDLRSENEKITGELKDLREKVQNLDGELLRLEEMLLEYTSRPCACK